jgi:hypothetical protein
MYFKAFMFKGAIEEDDPDEAIESILTKFFDLMNTFKMRKKLST